MSRVESLSCLTWRSTGAPALMATATTVRKKQTTTEAKTRRVRLTSAWYFGRDLR